MATKELDDWLQGRKVESVHPTNTSTIKSVEAIVCPICNKKDKSRQKAERQGAQDACDYYRCEVGHITIYRLGWTRERFITEGS